MANSHDVGKELGHGEGRVVLEGLDVTSHQRVGVTSEACEALPGGAFVTGHVLQGEEGQEAVAHLLQRAVAVEDSGVVVGGSEVTRGPDDVAGLDHYRLGKADTERCSVP